MKYLIWGALCVLVVLWLARAKNKAAAGADPVGADEAMVPCRHCGVHVPRSEAVTAADQLFCSEAHRLQHLAR